MTKCDLGLNGGRALIGGRAPGPEGAYYVRLEGGLVTGPVPVDVLMTAVRAQRQSTNAHSAWFEQKGPLGELVDVHSFPTLHDTVLHSMLQARETSQIAAGALRELAISAKAPLVRMRLPADDAKLTSKHGLKIAAALETKLGKLFFNREEASFDAASPTRVKRRLSNIAAEASPSEPGSTAASVTLESDSPDGNRKRGTRVRYAGII